MKVKRKIYFKNKQYLCKIIKNVMKGFVKN